MGDAVESLSEVLALTVVSARRCMHDLDHAINYMSPGPQRDLFRERARVWRAIFYPDNGPKNYRHKLHVDIDVLEARCRRYEEILRSNGLEEHIDGTF